MQILEKWPLQYLATLHPRRIEDALGSITPELAVYRKEKGEIRLFAIMTLLIDDLLDFFSVSRTIGERQMAVTIKMIADDFYYFNTEDFKLCFDNAKRGKYGKIYDRIDGNVIYEWLQKYSQERIGIAYPEAYYLPEIANKNDRLSGKRQEDFEKFRIAYIAEKSLKK